MKELKIIIKEELVKLRYIILFLTIWCIGCNILYIKYFGTKDVSNLIFDHLLPTVVFLILSVLSFVWKQKNN